MARHLGRHRDTDAQLIITFMLIPGQTTHALVTYTDDIQESLRKEVLAALGSSEGQSSDSLSNVFGRRMFADSGKPILQVLHEANKLVKLPIDEVVMTPDANHRIPLRSVLEALNQIQPPTGEQDRFNPHTHNTVTENQQESLQIAKNLLVEAELLEQDAQNKRARAYHMAPSLAPVAEPTTMPAITAVSASVEATTSPDTTVSPANAE